MDVVRKENITRKTNQTEKYVLDAEELFNNPWFIWGFTDARNGFGFSAAYETAEKSDQCIYEQGRQFYVCTKGSRADIYPECNLRSPIVIDWLTGCWVNARSPWGML